MTFVYISISLKASNILENQRHLKEVNAQLHNNLYHNKLVI